MEKRSCYNAVHYGLDITKETRVNLANWNSQINQNMSFNSSLNYPPGYFSYQNY